MGACFAGGLSSDEVVDRMSTLSRRDVATPSASIVLGPWAKSLLSGRRLAETLAALVPSRRLSELRKPLTVTAVDAETGALTLFGAGGNSDVPLIRALSASCALPIYYPPVEIDGRHYVDGGLRAVLPLDVAATFDPDLVFAVRVGPSFAAKATRHSAGVPPLLEAHNRVMRIVMAAQTDDGIARWHGGRTPLIVVEPPVEQGSTFALPSMTRYVDEGYRAAAEALDGSHSLW